MRACGCRARGASLLQRSCAPAASTSPTTCWQKLKSWRRTEMHWDAVIEFPKMKVAVATRDVNGSPCVAAIRYLPPEAATQAPESKLAERAGRQLERYREDP